jgi:PST family polysaccharide transporter
MKGKTSMLSSLKATAVLASSSIVTVLLGLISSKVYAVALGPPGLGFLVLLQSLLGFAGLLVGMGIGTGIIRLVPSALADKNLEEVAALYKAARLLLWILGCAGILIFVLFSGPISQLMLGSSAYALNVALVSPALLLNLTAGLATSFLNAHHRIKTLAKVTVVTSIASTIVNVGLIWVWRIDGITVAFIAGAAINWLVVHYFVRKEIGPVATPLSNAPLLPTFKRLLQFGIPYTGSMLVGTGVQLLMPVLVLHTLGAGVVGYYRAAITVSVSYPGFLLTAMGQDYFPRVSAARDEPAELGRLVNDQYRLVLIIGVPLILCLLALTPLLIAVIYTPQFAPAVDVLEWQLIGDLFKLSSWTLGYVILARSSGQVLFLTEFIAGCMLVFTSWAGMQWFGTVGLGIGFLITYIVHFLVNWAIVRREIHFAWNRSNTLIFLAALSAALVIRVMPFLGLIDYRTPVALAFALLAGAASLYILWKDVGGRKLIFAMRGGRNE